MKKKIIITIISFIFLCLCVTAYFYKDRILKIYKEQTKNNIMENTEVKQSLTVEIDSEIKDTDYFNKLIDEDIKEIKIIKDGSIINDIQIGNYDVEIITNKNTYKTKLNVEDKTTPSLKLKELVIQENEIYDIMSFIEICEDNSKEECLLEYENEDMGKYTKEGTYDITINASDNSNNKTSQITKLIINKKDKTKTNESNIKSNINKNSNINTTKNVNVNNNKNTNKTNTTTNKANKETNNKTNNNTSYVITEEVKMEDIDTGYKPESTHGPFVPPKSHNVTLVMDEGKYISIVGITEGQTIRHIKETSKEGRIFKEWQRDGKTFDPATPIMENMTLKAVYEEDSNVKTEVSKYGTKIITRNNVKSYDFSTYNATTNDLKPEAKSVAASNKTTYQEILKYVNELREKEESSPLVLEDKLSEAATARAIEMAWANKFSHTRPNNTTCFTIIDEYNISAFAAAENIAIDQRTAKEAFNSWNTSSGHHANMINKNFTKIGIGKYILNGRYYWVQLFIK